VKIIGNVQHAIAVDPTVVLGGKSRPGECQVEHETGPICGEKFHERLDRL
jgi:hypothetical protein